MPQENFSPFISSRRFSERGDGTGVQCTKSLDRLISTPGYHSKVELATKYSPLQHRKTDQDGNREELGFLPGRWTHTSYTPNLKLTATDCRFVILYGKRLPLSNNFFKFLQKKKEPLFRDSFFLRRVMQLLLDRTHCESADDKS